MRRAAALEAAAQLEGCLARRSMGGRLAPATGVSILGRLRPNVVQAAGLFDRRLLWSSPMRWMALDNKQAAPPAHVSPAANATAPAAPLEQPLRRLPLTCHGCGAFSQTSDPTQLGYFEPRSRRVRYWIKPSREARASFSHKDEDKLVDDVLASLDSSKCEELGLNSSTLVAEGYPERVDEAAIRTPLCDRCHNLVHHSVASETAKLAMHHPTVETLRESIEESPHKHHHIYHIIDAADFPMSLIPRLNVLLGEIPLRSRNRRSRASKYYKDRLTEMSFIITRSDLLAPTKEMVDSLMPYLREELRLALGNTGAKLRLGNVRCVSAKRGWWTRTVKEDIWNRGGAGWMVGKVNVGKSQLFEAVFPKGRILQDSMEASSNATGSCPNHLSLGAGKDKENGAGEEEGDLGQLLPPLRSVEEYPEMPVVSALPGTTASPIRIPFGNGKGELVDLPGLARSDLETWVKEERKADLIMKTRIVPKQVSVGPGKSLLLGGGLIRITPRSSQAVFLMYNFTPLEEHLTSTEKAMDFQEQKRESAGLENITRVGAGDAMKLAGSFQLRYDVTKQRAGPLTRKNALGLKVEQLPFRVVSVDILIEGVGYVEIAAQVRARQFEQWASGQGAAEEGPRAHEDSGSVASDNDPLAALVEGRQTETDDGAGSRARNLGEESDWPAVDVYTPEGRFVASRRPMGGWINNKPRVRPEHRRSRPRRSMKGHKKRAKKQRRAEEALRQDGAAAEASGD